MTEDDVALWAPRAIRPLSGDEPLAPELEVRHFWSWAFSDLRHNTTRGLLAQFLVARALGDERATDVGWDTYDVRTPDGVRIEVKAFGYLQSWGQAKPSRITFSRLTSRTWSDMDGWSTDLDVRADLFVFAVHTCTDAALYDAHDLAAWDFYVLPAAMVQSLSTRSIGLATVRRHAGPAVGWSALRAAVDAARWPDGRDESGTG